MRRKTLAVTIALLALVGLAPAARAQGKFHPGPHAPPAGHPAPVPHPALPKTPSINPGPVFKPPTIVQPVVKPPVVKPISPPMVKLPTNFERPHELPKVTQPVVIVKPPEKHVEHVVTPGKVIVGSAGVGHPAEHSKVYKWTPLPKEVAHFHAPAGKVRISPEIHKKVELALVKRPPKVGGKDWNTVSVQRYRNYGVDIRNHFRPTQHTWFTRNWWDRHHVGDYPRWHYFHDFQRHPWYYWWRHATWPVFAAWFPATWGQPFYYDYGYNVLFQDNLVYINDVPVASPVQYAEQAFALADVAPPANADVDWLPLGAYALSSSQNDANPSIVLQLAVSKDGLVSGTYFDQTTDQATPLVGSVDAATQRLALRPVDRDDLVLETGVYNLTQPQTPVLMHFGIDDTQVWYLVRLSAPPEE